MSVHKSLKSKSALTRPRSVLTRFERLAKLEDEERWEEGKSVFGLPKVKTARPKLRKKAAKKVEDEDAVAVEGEAAATDAPAAK